VAAVSVVDDALGAPRAPFEAWPAPDWNWGAGYAWRAEPAAIVTQALLSVPERAHGQQLSQLVDRHAAAHPEEVEHAGGLLLIHDWRAFYTYDPALRSFYLERMLERRPYRVRAIILAVSVRGFIRMAARPFSMLAERSLGITVDLVDDPAPVLARHGVRPHPR
jgi:hypothetical protein